MKLHLGCWKRYFPGWVHVDQINAPHIDHNEPVYPLHFIPPESCELIYASHVLEYFSFEEIPQVLDDWNTRLCQGGIMRLAVPNFRELANLYLEHSDIKIVKGPIMGLMSFRTHDGTERVISHKSILDHESLENLMLEAGLCNVREWDWRIVDHGKYDDHSQAYYPHMDKVNGTHISLNLEGVKS